MNTNTYTWYKIDQRFSDDWCEDLINRASSLTLESAIVRQPTSYNKIEDRPDYDLRTTDVLFLDRNDFADVYQAVSTPVLGANREFFGFDLADAQNFQFTKYEGSNRSHYGWHFDQLFHEELPYSRKLSVVIPLSDPNTFEGGDFEFRDTGSPDRQSDMKRGSIICFPSYYMHRVTPVTKGTRYSLVCWFIGPPFR